MPALRTALGSTVDALKEGARGSLGRARHRLLSSLVVAQFALALMLSVGAGLLLRSFVHLLDTQPGFRPAHVVRVATTLPAGRYETGAQVKAFHQQVGRCGAAAAWRRRSRRRQRSSAGGARAADLYRRFECAAAGRAQSRHRLHVDRWQLFRGARHSVDARPVLHRCRRPRRASRDHRQRPARAGTVARPGSDRPPDQMGRQLVPRSVDDRCGRGRRREAEHARYADDRADVRALRAGVGRRGR